MITFALFTPAHADDLKRMIDALSAYHGDTAAVTPAQIAQSAQDGITHTLLAFDDGRAVGFVSGYDWMGLVRGVRSYHIDLIYVDETHRSRGLGAELVRQANILAQARGCTRITVTASPDNAGANRFYAGLGFNARDKKPNGYWIDSTALQGQET